MDTPYHAKYFAHFLGSNRGGEGVARISASLFDAQVELNPHQIDAALFAMRSPLATGALLADEVGLGKTIEAGLVMCQSWAERRRKLLVICPASLRVQWQRELSEKFNLPCLILDTKEYKRLQKSGEPNPFASNSVVIASYNFAARCEEDVLPIDWDLIVFDEAHKLRNCYREGNRMGRALIKATAGRKKLLLTATPLQNSLLELYGLSCLLDEYMFGDIDTFKSAYMNSGGDLEELKRRLAGFSKRTLRADVQEFVKYTQRHLMCEQFDPTDSEWRLYEGVSAFLQQEDSYAIPHARRHLTSMVCRKLLASSSRAIEKTLRGMIARLRGLLSEQPQPDDLFTKQLEEMMQDAGLTEDDVEEMLESVQTSERLSPEQVDRIRVTAEIEQLKRLLKLAESINVDTKSKALVRGLGTALDRMAAQGAPRKALVFTESRRTQDYLKEYLDQNGYAGRIVCFSGSNSSPETKAIYEDWLAKEQAAGRKTSGRLIDTRTALVEHFRDKAEIMIATEAGAEGINLQFCSLVINYDLPWNPQRIEQRIGRCHRYGQKHDVVVLNFLNRKNHADQRVHELLNDKFQLFEGVFGSSDEVLGSVMSGVDFERKIHDIYARCRTREEIDAAFNELRRQMEPEITAKMLETREALLHNFDEQVHERLRLRVDEAKVHLDKIGRRFWALSRQALADWAEFETEAHRFRLLRPPLDHERTPAGVYHLISKDRTDGPTAAGHLYRLTHPLGEWSISQAKAAATPPAEVVFKITGQQPPIRVLEELKGKRGWLSAARLDVVGAGPETHLLFTGVRSDGEPVDGEVLERMFDCRSASVAGPCMVPEEVRERLEAEMQQAMDGTLVRSESESLRFLNERFEVIDRWADDKETALDKDILRKKAELRKASSEAIASTSLGDRERWEKERDKLQRELQRLRKQREDAFDELMDKRDEIKRKLQKAARQTSTSEGLFVIGWRVE